MSERRRVNRELSLNDRLKQFSAALKAEAAELHPSPEKDALLKRARIADTASHIDDWANSPGLRRPK